MAFKHIFNTQRSLPQLEVLVNNPNWQIHEFQINIVE
jgi:hypothetical protein